VVPSIAFLLDQLLSSQHHSILVEREERDFWFSDKFRRLSNFSFPPIPTIFAFLVEPKKMSPAFFSAQIVTLV